MRAGNHAERGANPCRRQPAGIAVGQQTAAGFHQRTAGIRDGLAQLLVFINQTQRFRHQRRHKILLPESQLHAVEVVHQVHRRRAGCPQGLQRHSQFITAFAVFRQKGQQQACRETNQRCPAYAQGVNMADQRLYRRGVKPAFLLRKRLLIENK